MQRYRILMRVVAVAALASAIGACSSDLSLSNVTLVPKPETLMRKPDWATFSGGKNDFELFGREQSLRFTAQDMLELFGAKLTPNRQKCCLLSWRVMQAAVYSPLNSNHENANDLNGANPIS